nr:hypothetical protein [uncultured Carboxylicivirga sp.]
MKKYQILLIAILIITTNRIVAQDSTSVDTLGHTIISPIKFFTNEENDMKLIQKLRIYEGSISLMCNPKINMIEYKDFKTDSTDNITLISKETYIFLKYSYNWDLKGELPKVPKPAVIKTLFKRKDKITEEEWKILKYMEYYYLKNPKLKPLIVDKFVQTQEVEVNGLERFKVEYELRHNNEGDFVLTSKNVEKL